MSLSYLTIRFRYENGDFRFGAEMDNMIKGSNDILFNRSAQINEALNTSNQYSIKKVAFSPNGIPFQAWLFGGTQTLRSPVVKEEEKNSFYDFDMYANEQDATSDKPNLILYSPANTKKHATAKRR